VLFEYAKRGLIILQLAKRVLINNRIIIRVVEDTWRYPRLLKELD